MLHLRRAVLALVVLAVCARPNDRANAWPMPSVLPKPAVITGRIVDARSGAPVGFARILLDTLHIESHSDAGGRFILTGVPPGRRELSIRSGGYAELRASVTLAPADSIGMNFFMHRLVLELDPIVVTATRKEQTARMAPASVSVMSDREIGNREPLTFDQAVETMPGLSAFRSTGGISVQSMSIRGSSDVAGGGVGNRVLLLIDGRPALTSDSGGAFWSLVPVQFVDRVEVVKGAFSSLYGSTAMGGVINVITRRPGPTPSARLEMRLGYFEKPPTHLRYTNDAQFQSEISADYSSVIGRASVLLSATRKQSDGHAENTAFEFYDVYGKLIYNIASNQKLELTLGGGEAENDYPHGWLNSAQPLEVRDAYTDDSQEKHYANADLLYWGLRGDDMKYSVRTYYYRHEQRSFFNEDDPTGSIPGNEPFGLRTEIDGEKLGNLVQLEWMPVEHHHLVVGADVQIDDVESAPDTVMYGDRQVNNYAVFVQDEITLHPRLTLTAGGRYDWNRLVGVRTLEQFTPKLGVVWSADAKIALRALYGQAFRAPTIAEMYLQKELGGGVEFLPNPDLEPERVTRSLEAGIHWSPAAILDLDAGWFQSTYEDMIYWEDISAETGIPFLYQVRNLNRARMEGVELSARSRWRSIGATASYTYVNARDESEGRDNDTLPYRPAHVASLAADVEWQRWMLHGDARFRSEIDEVYLYPLQAPDAFWVFNGAVQCRLASHWMLSVKVNNVLNSSYEELARYRMPGRNWLFGAAFQL